MSLKHRIVNTLIMNIPVALSICLAAQLLATGTINPGLTCINFAIAYVVSFVVGMFVPLVPWGMAFAGKCKAKPGSLPFGLLLNLVVNTGYVLANSLVLTYFNAVVLGGAPLIGYVFAILSTFIPLWIVGYIVSFLWNGPAEKITKAICKD